MDGWMAGWMAGWLVKSDNKAHYGLPYGSLLQAECGNYPCFLTTTDKYSPSAICWTWPLTLAQYVLYPKKKTPCKKKIINISEPCRISKGIDYLFVPENLHKIVCHLHYFMHNDDDDFWAVRSTSPHTWFCAMSGVL